MTMHTFELREKFVNVIKGDTSHIWTFYFTNDIVLNSETIWRLSCKNLIILVSEDDEQLFGLSNPINVSSILVEKLKGKNLSKISIADSGDITLYFDEDVIIEFWVTSIGYENYQLSIGGNRYISSGANNIVILPNQ